MTEREPWTKAELRLVSRSGRKLPRISGPGVTNPTPEQQRIAREDAAAAAQRIEREHGPYQWVWCLTCRGQGCPEDDFKGGWYEKWPWNRSNESVA